MIFRSMFLIVLIGASSSSLAQSTLFGGAWQKVGSVASAEMQPLEVNGRSTEALQVRFGQRYLNKMIIGMQLGGLSRSIKAPGDADGTMGYYEYGAWVEYEALRFRFVQLNASLALGQAVEDFRPEDESEKLISRSSPFLQPGVYSFARLTERTQVGLGYAYRKIYNEAVSSNTRLDVSGYAVTLAVRTGLL